MGGIAFIFIMSLVREHSCNHAKEKREDWVIYPRRSNEVNRENNKKDDDRLFHKFFNATVPSVL